MIKSLITIISLLASLAILVFISEWLSIGVFGWMIVFLFAGFVYAVVSNLTSAVFGLVFMLFNFLRGQ